jgi:hypothetical protein
MQFRDGVPQREIVSELARQRTNEHHGFGAAMSGDDERRSLTLQISWTDHAPTKLAARVQEFRRRDQQVDLDGKVASIQFLRGAAARAGFALPALYLALGARMLPDSERRPHWQVVQAAALEQSSLQTISLACRAIFDDSKSRLSGKRIARMRSDTLESVAKYWSENSGRTMEDASKALDFLRSLFIRCAQPEKVLLDQPSLLERRIGLLKYHAHRQAAHISIEDYLFDILDLVHVTAAIVLIGAVISDFDNASGTDRYFDSIDEGGWMAAKTVFPGLPIKRIFNGWDIHTQAALTWKRPYADGVEYVLNQLPTALGYWDSERESK